MGKPGNCSCTACGVQRRRPEKKDGGINDLTTDCNSFEHINKPECQKGGGNADAGGDGGLNFGFGDADAGGDGGANLGFGDADAGGDGGVNLGFGDADAGGGVSSDDSGGDSGGFSFDFGNFGF